jgi:hypothetical protein
MPLMASGTLRIDRGRNAVRRRASMEGFLESSNLDCFQKEAPSARTSKGFLIVGTGVAACRSCSNRAASWSDVPDQLTQPLSALKDGWFKSNRLLQRQISEPLHGMLTT